MVKESNKLKTLKIRYFGMILLIFITLIIILSIALNYMDMKKEGQAISKLLIEQNSLAQTMTKDVDKIYLIMGTLDSSEALNNKLRLESKLYNTRQELFKHMNTYDTKIYQVQNGVIEYGSIKAKIWDKNTKILKPDIKENIEIWESMKKNYMQIYENDFTSIEFRQAYKYIEENSHKLIEASDRLSEKFIKSNNKIYSDFSNVSVIVVGVLGILIIITIYQLYKYFLLPLEELYNGFKEIGFENIMEKNVME